MAGWAGVHYSVCREGKNVKLSCTAAGFYIIMDFTANAPGKRRMTMDHFGFIHDKLDIKILILYILEKLPAPVEALTLSDLTLFDGGFTWFDYTDCLAELVELGHVDQEDGKYEITEKGRRNLSYIQTTLPYTVRVKADRLTAPVAAAMRRSSMIETATEKARDGSLSVSLRMSDGVGEIISMRLAVPDEEKAAAIEKRFRDSAESIYQKILALLTEQ